MKKKFLALYILLFCNLIVIVFAIYYVTYIRQNIVGNDATITDSTEKEEKQAKKFEFTINSDIELLNGASAGDLKIQNKKRNDYNMEVSIVDDQGKQIYYSNVLEPGQILLKDVLDVDLEKGEYNCSAVFTALDFSSGERVRQSTMDINIRVLN